MGIISCGHVAGVLVYDSTGKGGKKSHGGCYTPMNSGEEEKDTTVTLDSELIPHFISHLCV